MSEQNGTISPELMLRMYESALQSRASFASQHGMAFGGDRDYYGTLGYNRQITAEQRHEEFERGGIARRIVTAYPDAVWRLKPKIYEDDTEANTPFEQAFEDMERRLRLFHHFYRADVLACLDRFSLLFIGFNDAGSIEALAQPVSRGARQVNYVSAYSELYAEVAEYDTNIASPRFGLPSMYLIDLDRGGFDAKYASTVGGFGRQKVHWQRVIHIADDLVEDEVFGTPKYHPVWNYLADLIKVVGGSGEAFWRNAQRHLIFEIDSDAQLSDAALATMRENAEEFLHGLKQVLGIEGAAAKSIPPAIASPEDTFNVLVHLIGGTLKIPNRVLLGSERGELASSQDEMNWANQCTVRQTEFNEPTIIRAFLDRCISFSALPTPASGVDGYTVEWMPLITEDENEKADRILKYAQALDTVSRGLTLDTFPKQEFRETVMGWDAESPYQSELDRELAEQEDEEEEMEQVEDAKSGPDEDSDATE